MGRYLFLPGRSLFSNHLSGWSLSLDDYQPVESFAGFDGAPGTVFEPETVSVESLRWLDTASGNGTVDIDLPFFLLHRGLVAAVVMVIFFPHLTYMVSVCLSAFDSGSPESQGHVLHDSVLPALWAIGRLNSGIDQDW